MTLKTWLKNVKTETGTIIDVDTEIGEGTVIRKYVVIYKSTIGKNCKIGSFAVIGGATIGDNCKILDYAFIPPGVTIGNRVFIGPHVCFTNDRYPEACPENHFTPLKTTVMDDVAIGANSTILSGITVGERALIGAGSIVACNVEPNCKFYGESAKYRGTVH